MLEKLKQLPHPGLRNIKTCIAVVVIIIIYQVTARSGVTLALVAAVLCMQESVDKSIRLGIIRGGGTLIGGLFGALFIYLRLNLLDFPLFLICVFFAVMIFIFICNLVGARSTIFIGCVVFFTIIFEVPEANPFLSAVNKTIDTLIGIIVSFVINQLIFRPRPERHRGKTSVNPFFHYEIRRAGNQKLMGWQGEDTTELYIYPEDELCEERRFDFRLSHTVVKMRESGFYKFPGYKRHVMLLDGQMHLYHSFNGKLNHSKHLSKYDVDYFRGEWDTHCKGQGSDLCLMTKDTYSGSMEPVSAPGVYTLKNDSFEGFYILADNTRINLTYEGAAHSEILNKGDFLLIGWYTNGTKSYAVSFDESQPPMADEVVAIRVSCPGTNTRNKPVDH